MRTLTQQEQASVSGADAGLAIGFLGGMAIMKAWDWMSMPSEYYILEQHYEEYDVQTPLYDAYGNVSHYQIDTYGEYVPVYVKVS